MRVGVPGSVDVRIVLAVAAKGRTYLSPYGHTNSDIELGMA